MPWVEGENGEKKYVVSLYCKEELPTWDELYNEFFSKQLYRYDPTHPNHQNLDPYWNRPRRKILLSWVCNQLNKMIFEDGINVTQALSNKYDIPFEKVHFILAEEHPSDKDSVFTDKIERLITLKGAPEIYTCKLPSTKEYSIFASNHPHFDIDNFHGPIRLIAVASTDVGMSISNYGEFQEVVKYVMKDVINYFEKGIGWKDEEGNILPVDPSSNRCEGVGFDPAL